MRIFILEDDPARKIAFEQALGVFEKGFPHEVTICSFLGGVGGAYINFEGEYDLIMLDHDLGGAQMVSPDEEETGTAFVKWLVENNKLKNGPKVIIHSWNPDGARRMLELLPLNCMAFWEPFGHTVLNYLKEYTS